MIEFEGLLHNAGSMTWYRRNGSYHSVFSCYCTEEQAPELLETVAGYGVRWMDGQDPRKKPYNIGEVYVFYVDNNANNDIRIMFAHEKESIDESYGPIFDFCDIFVDVSDDGITDFDVSSVL